VTYIQLNNKNIPLKITARVFTLASSTHSSSARASLLEEPTRTDGIPF
jgi:hypothetical protein